MSGIKGMKRSKEHNIKISIALKGKRKSKIHCDRISKKAKIRLSIPENNPNFRGDNVGYVGIHIWIVKKFGLADICELALNLRCADCLDEVIQVSSELKDEVNFFEIAKRKNYGSED